MVTTAAPECTAPSSITGGTVVTSGPYYNGSLAVYQCLTGYLISGDSYITCLNTVWTGTAPSCLRQDTNEILLTLNQDNMPSWVAYMIAILCGLAAFLILVCILAACCHIICGRNGYYGGQGSGSILCCRRNRNESYDTLSDKRICKTFPRRYEYDDNGRRYHMDDLGRRCYYNHKNQLNHVKVVNYSESDGTESQTTKTTFVTAVNEVIADKRNQPAKEIIAWKPHANPVRNINTSTK